MTTFEARDLLRIAGWHEGVEIENFVSFDRAGNRTELWRVKLLDEQGYRLHEATGPELAIAAWKAKESFELWREEEEASHFMEMVQRNACE